MQPLGCIQAQGWGCRHPGRASWVLRDVNFAIAPGSFTVLLGASGSGKSTLLRAMAGVHPEGETVGRLEVGGEVGLVSQDPSGNIVMESVGDDVAFGLENRAVDPARIWPAVAGALAGVGLGVGPGRPTNALSGGQQQLLALAAASAPRPAVLLLDEPTANLDPQAAGTVVSAVLRVRAETGCTVVLVEHRMHPWWAAVDEVLLLRPGGPAAGPSVQSRAVMLPADELGAYLRGAEDLAGHVWLDRSDLVSRPPVRPPGRPVLTVSGLAMSTRLPVATDLQVRAGEVVALVGPPGSGKSTILGCISGLLRPTAGTVTLAGPNGARAQPWQWGSRDVAASFGVVFQNPEHQFLTGRVRDELAHGLAVTGVHGAQATDRVDRLLDQLHLDHVAAANPFTLSGGEQRRLSVGTALIRDPGVLLLDEPTFGQDPASWSQVVGMIADHRDAGGAVLLATHDPQLVAALGAREVRLPAAPSPPKPEPIDAVGGRLRRLNPLTLLGCAVALSVAGLASRSVSTNVVLALTCALAALVGRVPATRLGRLSVPALVAAASVLLSNVLLAPGGLALPGNWAAAMLPATRVLAVALPGLIAAVSLDPTALADSLTRWMRVPPRAAYSVLAALRLLPLLSAEWGTLRQASRARGVSGRTPAARAAQFVSLTFRLLVAALRRGGRLAVALDSRGLRDGAPRTQARPSLLGWPDLVSALGVVGLLAALVVLPGG